MGSLGSVSHPEGAYRLMAVIALLAMGGLAHVITMNRVERARQQTEVHQPWQQSLPVGAWIELKTTGQQQPAFRAQHGGVAYDPKRRSLLMFGSDEHLVCHDDAVYELDLTSLTWTRHQRPAPPYSARVDEQGNRVAGVAQLQPWPMHVYDAMTFDPKNDELLVFSGPKHSFRPTVGLQRDTGWSYSLARREWRKAAPLEGGLPNFFATGVVYDSRRDTLIGYGSMRNETAGIRLGGEPSTPRVGVWELGPDRQRWIEVSDEIHHWGWFNAEYDASVGRMLVFGGDESAGSIWEYEPGGAAGQPGHWMQRFPEGDRCPSGLYFPAAYSSRHQATLVLPPDPNSRRPVTCLYDAQHNRWHRMAADQLPPLRVNYSLIYSPELDVFVLVTGDYLSNERTRVWALRLPVYQPER